MPGYSSLGYLPCRGATRSRVRAAVSLVEPRCFHPPTAAAIVVTAARTHRRGEGGRGGRGVTGGGGFEEHARAVLVAGAGGTAAATDRVRIEWGLGEVLKAADADEEDFILVPVRMTHGTTCRWVGGGHPRVQCVLASMRG